MDCERGAKKAPSLSAELYGIEWERETPLKICGGQILVSPCEFSETLAFARAHYASLFESSETRFDLEPFTKQKLRYYNRAADSFRISSAEDTETTIGVFVSSPIDWCTYYLRSTAIIKEYRGKGILGELITRLFDVLKRHGVSRVEADISPANRINLHVLNRIGMRQTGFQCTERWGAMIRFTAFLDETLDQKFLDLFCAGPRPAPAQSILSLERRPTHETKIR